MLGIRISSCLGFPGDYYNWQYIKNLASVLLCFHSSWPSIIISDIINCFIKTIQILSLASTWGPIRYFGNPISEELLSESDFTRVNLKIAKIGKHRTVHVEVVHIAKKKVTIIKSLTILPLDISLCSTSVHYCVKHKHKKSPSCRYSTIFAVIFIQFSQYQIFWAVRLDFKVKDSEVMNQGKQ